MSSHLAGLALRRRLSAEARGLRDAAPVHHPRIRVFRILLLAAVSLSGCDTDPRSDGIRVSRENGITALTYSTEALAGFVLPASEADRAFDLRDLTPDRPATRVGVRWDARTFGGLTAVQVRAEGDADWKTVQVDREEYVPELDTTLFGGHLDLPATGRVWSRVKMVRAEGSPSPVFTALTVELFDRAEIAETGSPAGPVPASDSVLPIAERSTWGARAAVCQGDPHDPYRMTFHHTDTPNGERGAAARARMRQVQSYHIDAHGWCDIGYHLAVDADGLFYRGGSTANRTGAHVEADNPGNLGIALLGSYASAAPSEAQIDGLAAAMAHYAREFGIVLDGDRVRGHRQWPGASTDCPGTRTLERKSQILQLARAKRDAAGTGAFPGAIVVDDASAAFAASGAWWESTNVSGYFGSGYRVAETTGANDPAIWSAELEARSYEVYVRFSADINRTPQARYTVSHAGGETAFLVDQRQNGGVWVSLGTFAMAPGPTVRVRLHASGPEGAYAIADAVKFEPR